MTQSALYGKTRLDGDQPLVIRGVRALDASGASPIQWTLWSLTVSSTPWRVASRLQGALQVDAQGLWLMPGVFDCHVHVGMSSVDTLTNLQTPLSLRALQTASNLSVTLGSGVTHVRDAGGVDAGLRAGIEQGLIAGRSWRSPL